jgi:hypothetical protein
MQEESSPMCEQNRNESRQWCYRLLLGVFLALSGSLHHARAEDRIRPWVKLFQPSVGSPTGLRSRSNLESNPSDKAHLTLSSGSPIVLDDLHSEAAVSARAKQDLSEAARGHELSVEPGTAPLLPADAPAWISAPPDFSQDIHHLVVGSLLAENPEDVDALLDEPLVAAVKQYIDGHLVNQLGAAARLRPAIRADYIRKNMIDAPEGFVARLNSTDTPMFQKWVVVSVTPEQREQIKLWHREALQRMRIAPLGVGLFGLLGAVGLTHVVLRTLSSGLTTSKTTPHTHSGIPLAEMKKQ